MSELDPYLMILTLAKAMPMKRNQKNPNYKIPNEFEHYLYYLDDTNFIGKIKDQFGITTDEDIKRAMTLEDDKYWIKKIHLQVLSILNSIPDMQLKECLEGLFMLLWRINRREKK
jgi:hypothetical protein